MVDREWIEEWRAREREFVDRAVAAAGDRLSPALFLRALHPEYEFAFLDAQRFTTNYVFCARVRPQLCFADRLIVDIHPYRDPADFAAQYGVTAEEMMILVEAGRVLPVFHANLDRYEGLDYLAACGLLRKTRPSNLRTNALFDAESAYQLGLEVFDRNASAISIGSSSRSWSRRYGKGETARSYATRIRYARIHTFYPELLQDVLLDDKLVALLDALVIDPWTKALGCTFTTDERVLAVRTCDVRTSYDETDPRELVVAQAAITLDLGQSFLQGERLPSDDWTAAFRLLVAQLVQLDQNASVDVAELRDKVRQRLMEWERLYRRRRTRVTHVTGSIVLAALFGGAASAVYGSQLSAAEVIFTGAAAVGVVWADKLKRRLVELFRGERARAQYRYMWLRSMLDEEAR
jgi:hypothetical protein